MKAEKFARRFAKRSWRNEVRVEVRSPHIFVSRLRCPTFGDCCEGSVDTLVSPPDPRRREAAPVSEPPEYIQAARVWSHQTNRWCLGRGVGWRIPCRQANTPRAGVCRAAPLASGSWVSWFCDLGASVSFGGPNRNHDASFASVKATEMRSVRDGIAVFGVRLRWKPEHAARPVLGALRYEARRWCLRLAVLPRYKADQRNCSRTSYEVRSQGRTWRRKVQSGQWRVVQDPHFDMLVRVDGSTL